LFHTFSKIYTFTAEELSDFTQIELNTVISFLDRFSCGFPSLGNDDKIFEPYSFLRLKPILYHKDRYLVPSLPLLTWSVEDIVEKEINNSPLSNKYIKLRHDFLITQGLEYFQNILPTATVYSPNLFYMYNNERCETDAIIIYDTVLFIVEAKGNRISSRARSGYTDRTKKHLEDMVKDSYSQGIRTLSYIENNQITNFETKDGKTVKIDSGKIDNIIIVSLTMEPIGNLAMLIKSTNQIGYFRHEYFPWIISIYDLVIIADLFDNPIMLIHYLKKRKKFLEFENFSVSDELDLVSYYLFNGLNIESQINSVKNEQFDRVHFGGETDEINDYYMYKFGYKKRFVKKPKCYFSYYLNDFLLQLDRSRINNRVEISLIFLELSDRSIKKLIELIGKTKKLSTKDKNIHDCSLYFESNGGFGITYLMSENLQELDKKLKEYCNFKMIQQNAKMWIGLGDTSTNQRVYKFETSYYQVSMGSNPWT
jgi:hypothetical protein